MPSLVPQTLRHRDFRLYLAGVALTQIGTMGTFAAMLYHVYALTGSTVQVGLVGAGRGVATLVLSPLGGHYADRVDRKLLLQLSQAFSMVTSLGLAALTYAGAVRTWHIIIASMLVSAGAAFDGPARKAIVPAMVPRAELVQAVALVNPTNQLGRLIGPGLGGVLIAVGGPELMYLLDGLTYIGLIAILAILSVPAMAAREGEALNLWGSLAEGVTYVRDRPVIYHLMGLDLSQTLFAAYRVVLPALAVDVLQVGPTGYGALSAAVPAGALLGGVIVYRLATSSVQEGHTVLATTALFGVAAIGLAQTRAFFIAMVCAVGLGVFDAIGATIRHAAVLIETPDQLRGRVNALYTMASRGGPAFGELNLGWVSGLLGASMALTVGAFVPIVYAGVIALSAQQIRDYRTAEPAT